MEQYLEAAVEAAKKAGEFIQSKSRNFNQVDYKGRVDLVTEVDRGSEEMIVTYLSDQFPDHSIIAEESDYQEKTGSHQWIIDPLDGTTNYVHAYPHYAVSIALRVNKELAVGVVYNPATDELFTAIRGEGAKLNNKPVHVSETTKLQTSMLSTGFPYKLGEHWHRSFDLFKLFYMKTHGLRRDGSAALNLCYVASGRLDGFFEYDLNPWDVSAGTLMVLEGGGVVSDYSGYESSVFDKEILAANNSQLQQQMLEVIQMFPGFSTKE